MATAKIDDLQMHYQVMGEGQPLVLIMGLAGTADWWGRAVLRPLARYFRLLIFDNRDAGRTTGPSTPYSIADMADDTARLMDHVGMTRAHVVGMSMGGMIAQELALRHPGQVDRLILGCTTPGFQTGVSPSSEVLGVMTADYRSGPRLRMVRDFARVTLAPGWLASHFYRIPGLIAMMLRNPVRPAAYSRQMAAIGVFDAGERLARIKAPTLVVHGDRDVLLPPENGRILARLIPGAKLVIFPGVAHGLNVENPRLFVSTVRDFLL